MYRIGIGYDVHALVPSRKLILGGVSIPHSLGLAGHSDADVLTHAIIDAILGAANLGDIGALFPDNDEKYAGADSLFLLREVYNLVQKHQWDIQNIDSVIIAQKPKLRPFIEEMKENYAQILSVRKEIISVKATTTEKLGFVGKEEGIAAEAVVMLKESV